MHKTKNNKKYYVDKYGNDLFFRQNIYHITVNNVEAGSHVLELGCASGHISSYLKNELDCKAFAIDINKENVELSRQRGVNTIEGDLETDECLNEIFDYIELNGKFDFIICTEVIEHLKSPELLLDNIKLFIKPEGKVIISTPNIAYWEIRLKLLFGNFEYKNIGILDETHLRFFTIKSFRDLLVSNNYEIVEFKYLYTHWQDLVFYMMRIIPFSGKVLKKLCKGLLTYQMIVIAKINQ